MINYEKINLEFNPFYELDLEDNYFLTITDIDIHEIVKKLMLGNYAIQFIGRKGRGKSTHMSYIHQYFSKENYYYIKSYFIKYEFENHNVYFIDEMQRLSRRKISELLNKNKSYVIGSHRNHSREFKKAGLEYDIIKLKGLNYEKLIKIVKKRLEFSKIDKSIDMPKIDEEKLKEYHNKYKDCIRKILHALYDDFYFFCKKN